MESLEETHCQEFLGTSKNQLIFLLNRLLEAMTQFHSRLSLTENRWKILLDDCCAVKYFPSMNENPFFESKVVGDQEKTGFFEFS